MRTVTISSESSVADSRRGPRFPWQLAAGLALLVPSWLVCWTVASNLREVLVPLYLGYSLIVDGLVRRRTGASLLTTSPWLFVVLFPASVLFWAPFEALGHHLNLWVYLAPHRHVVRPGHWFLFWRVFEVVIAIPILPDLWETAALYRSLLPGWSDRSSVVRASRRWAAVPLAAGLGCLVPLFVWPYLVYPLCWCPMFLIADALNARSGRPSLLWDAAHGRFTTLTVFGAAGLTCGFFWELWNYYSPGYHWIYNLRNFNDLPHLFGLPLPAYLDYVPLAWSAYAVVHLVLYRGRPQAIPRTSPAPAWW